MVELIRDNGDRISWDPHGLTDHYEIIKDFIQNSSYARKNKLEWQDGAVGAPDGTTAFEVGEVFHMTLAEKLKVLQNQISVNKTKKTKDYCYRELVDINSAIIKKGKESGILITYSDEPLLVGNKVYIKSTITATDVESGEQLSATGLARESESAPDMLPSQLTGCASTYARKYAADGLLLLDASTDDPDKKKSGETEPPKAEPSKSKTEEPEKVTYDMAKEAMKKALETEDGATKVKNALKAHKARSISQVPEKELKDFIKELGE